ncbi:hypothetical protein [Runella sp.]|uniref:hypothetical protein n=1 Tax=Runella sp. TaxID=1960881 RepID=UPI003D14C2DB
MFKAFELPQGATPLFFKEVKYPQGTLHGFELADGRRFYAQLDGPGTNMYGYVSQLDNVTKFQNPMPPATGRQKAYLLFRYEENGVCGYRQYEDSYDFPVKTTNTVLPDLIQPNTTPTVDKRFEACEQITVVKIDGNTFRIKTTNGRVTVEGTWQTFGKCADCPEAAEKALQAALLKARDRNGGSITESTLIVEGITKTYGSAGEITYQNMNLMDILKNLSKTYNSLVDKAKVPEAVWKPQEDLPAEEKNFIVQDKTRVISGALDQGIEEARDLPELVGMGLKVASDPQGAYDELSTFTQQMSWQKAKDFAKEAAKSTVQYDYLTNPKNEYKLYGTGRLGVSIVKLAAGGAALKFAAMVKKSPDFLTLWNKLRDKMDNLNRTQADKDRIIIPVPTSYG